MYFWNINKLEKDLKKGLSEKENMKYLLAFMLIFIPNMFPYSSVNLYDYLIILFFIIFIIFEILYLFKINKYNKWKNFLSRYFAIGFVIFIRSLIFILLPLMVLSIIILWFLYWENIPEYTTLLDFIFIIIYSLWYLFLQVKSFKRINS